MTTRAVWALGVGQCVSWGVLYYAFGVLLVPVEQELGVARWVLTGAFSVALLVSAFAAPAIGKLTDRGRGPAVMQSGGLVAAGLLAVWAAAPSVWSSYAIWGALGLCMAAVLYEPVFAVVGRAIADSADRVRAIATITVFGGLASTIFMPWTGWLVDRFGWRIGVYALAMSLAIVTVAVYRLALRDADSSGVRRDTTPADAISRPEMSMARASPPLAGLILTFACSSFASSAFATNLVAALIERRLTATTAATLAGSFGVMQLPGRLLVMNGRFSLAPTQLVWCSLGLQVTGLVVLVSASSLWWIIAGVSLFACGSGLVTLARPYLVLVLYGAGRAGHMNGLIARAQQLARAGGPVVMAAVAGATGYAVVFAMMAGLLATAAAALWAARGLDAPLSAERLATRI